jgi:hypothetical protein
MLCSASERRVLKNQSYGKEEERRKLPRLKISAQVHIPISASGYISQYHSRS